MKATGVSGADSDAQESLCFEDVTGVARKGTTERSERAPEAPSRRVAARGATEHDTVPRHHVSEEPGSSRRAGPWSIPPRGALLGRRMRTIERLGQGSQGEVHRAWDLYRDQMVALKFPRDADPTVGRDVLMREIIPLQALSHPHLVRLVETHLGERYGYIALELLDPEPLSVRATRAALPIGAALQAVLQVVDAVEAMHACGWVHRDVKAENVLFGDGGRAVLTDLGLARSERTLHGDGRMAPGTPSYMAPEVVRGEVTTLAGWRAVDQYALAVTAYVALTGALPFRERGIYALMYAHLACAPVPPSQRRAELQRFDVPLLRALSKDPGERFADVRTFGAALRRALALG